MKTKSQRRNTAQTCIAGEHYVLAELARRGAVASMTIRNTKGVDILVCAPDGKRMFKAEVKTCNYEPRPERLYHADGVKCVAWRLSRKHETIRDRNLVYALVWLPPAGARPRIFVVPSKKVADYVKWEHEHWLKLRRGKDTDMRNFRLPEPEWKTYENNWRLFGIQG